MEGEGRSGCSLHRRVHGIVPLDPLPIERRINAIVVQLGDVDERARLQELQGGAARSVEAQSSLQQAERGLGKLRDAELAGCPVELQQQLREFRQHCIAPAYEAA
jgi:hypothetical protein